jgi:hypothetical protein
VLASLQRAVGAVQLALVEHCTQRLSLPQTGVWPEQFCGPRHCTQREFATSHFGVSPPHWTSLVQPERHFCSCRSQMGVVPPQSRFEKHCTHSPLPLHLGAPAGQLALVAHCTHCWVVGLQTGCPAFLQSAPVLHPTHAPVVVALQIGAPPGQLPAVQEG